MGFISSGGVAWTGVHVLKLQTPAVSQPLDHVFFGEPQGGVLTLTKSSQPFQAQVIHQSSKYKQHKSNNNTLTFQTQHWHQNLNAVLNSSYIRQFYIYRPQASENLEDNLESKVRKFHSKVGFAWETPSPQKRIVLETPYHDSHTSRFIAGIEAKYMFSCHNKINLILLIKK